MLRTDRYLGDEDPGGTDDRGGYNGNYDFEFFRNPSYQTTSNLRGSLKIDPLPTPTIYTGDYGGYDMRRCTVCCLPWK